MAHSLVCMSVILLSAVPFSGMYFCAKCVFLFYECVVVINGHNVG